jgi:hypothetical protein
MRQYLANNEQVGDEGDDRQALVALRAFQDVGFESGFQ